jgi:hypothetical protein
LSAVESLDLALFFDGVRGRIDVEADHIAQFVDGLRIVESLNW